MTTAFTRPPVQGCPNLGIAPAPVHGSYAPKCLGLYNLLLLMKGVVGSLPLNFPMGCCNLEGVICKQKTHCSYTRGALYFTHHTSISKRYRTGGKY